jgi:hypothetical protein
MIMIIIVSIGVESERAGINYNGVPHIRIRLHMTYRGISARENCMRILRAATERGK